MKLAAVQYRPPKGRPDAARLDLARLIDEAGQRGAGLIVCPEMATTGYLWDSPAKLGPHTEPARGPTFAMLAGRARRHAAWIVCGFAERFVHVGRTGPAGGAVATLFNSALVVTPDGSLATCYRKVLLYDADLAWAAPGWRRPVCQAAFGGLAPGICMDINDPRFAAHLRETRPTVVAFCTNWIAEGLPVRPYWRERLLGWRGWFVAANTWGTDGDVGFSGESAILDPSGRAVAVGPAEGDAVVVADAPDLDGA